MDAKLYMILLGCRPKGRLTEQHDIFFGIANSIKELVDPIRKFWPEANGVIHVDAWREVTQVGGFSVRVVERSVQVETGENQLFFINLGGYKPGEFDEFHYKMLVVAKDKSSAVKHAKHTSFYQHTGFKGSESHIDDKYGVDVDEIYEINDILPDSFKSKFQLRIFEKKGNDDKIHLGYFKLDKL